MDKNLPSWLPLIYSPNRDWIIKTVNFSVQRCKSRAKAIWHHTSLSISGFQTETAATKLLIKTTVSLYVLFNFLNCAININTRSDYNFAWQSAADNQVEEVKANHQLKNSVIIQWLKPSPSHSDPFLFTNHPTPWHLTRSAVLTAGRVLGFVAGLWPSRSSSSR